MTTSTVTGTAGTSAAAHGRVAAWLVLLGMGGTSLTYNIAHAAHGHTLPWPLAVLFGLAPVGAAMGLSHIVAASPAGRSDWERWIMRGAALVVMLGAMALSVGATAAVIAPVAPGALRFLFPAVMDAASLVALQVILAPRQQPEVAPATGAAGAPEPATTAANMTATTATMAATTAAAAATAGRPATIAAPSGPAAGSGQAAADDARRIPAQRGEIRRLMREHWDSEIAQGRIPNGAELNRAADKEPDYSLGKRYAAEWREELPVIGETAREISREMSGERAGGPVAAGAGL